MDDLRILDSLPPLLNEIHDKPKQLWARGVVPSDPNLKWLTVVGSRACTNYGKQVVRHLVGGLRGQPIAIVSGLAYGIDAEAHRTALDVGLTCVAFPGSGLDWNAMYPRATVQLSKEILEKGGALLSEFKPEQRAADGRIVQLHFGFEIGFQFSDQACGPVGFFVRPTSGTKTQGLHGHNGVDIGASIGTPVFASAEGEVISAKSSGYNGGYGSMIIISHGGNIQTVYGHLSAVKVSVGQHVSQGQVIGAVGNTGKSTGTHLHFEVRGAKNPF